MEYRFMFLRTDKGVPVSCVAMKVSKSGEVTYGVSTQHPKDRFNRKVARELALGRMVSKPEVVKVNTISMHEISRTVVADLLKKEATPTRAYMAAKKWLKKASIKEMEASIKK